MSVTNNFIINGDVTYIVYKLICPNCWKSFNYVKIDPGEEFTNCIYCNEPISFYRPFKKKPSRIDLLRREFSFKKAEEEGEFPEVLEETFETKIFTKKINIRDKIFKFMPLGDFHIGHVKCDLELIYKYLDYAKENNFYLCLMGDEIEAAVTSHKPHGSEWDQNMNLDSQLDVFYSLMKPFKGRILTKVNSTHTMRIWKETSHDIDKEMAYKLDCTYLKTGNYWKLHLNDIEYIIFQQHGSGTSKYAEYQLNKCMEIFPGADLYLMGHVHQIFMKPYAKFFMKNGERIEKTIWGVRTGGFLKYPEYAQEKFYPAAIAGAPLIYFRTDMHHIDVKMMNEV